MRRRDWGSSCPSAPTGWLSWNVYFDLAGEKGNLAEARVAVKHLKPFGLEFWSVESWQEKSDVLPVSKFHTQTLRTHAQQFPHGMKWLAEQIRELGFRPGIWTVPFGTGDKLGELPAERMRLLQQALPVGDVRPLDLFPIFEMLPVWDLKIGRPFGQWDVVSLFNWGDQPTDGEFRFEELGLPADVEYLVYDFWNRSFRGSFRERFGASVPGRSNLLLAVHRSRGRPQFLSTDRHITQGGVSLENLAWDDASKVLSGSVRLVENFPSKLVFFAPNGYQLTSVEADGADVIETKTNADRTVTVTLRRTMSGMAAWRMKFQECM